MTAIQYFKQKNRTKQVQTNKNKKVILQNWVKLESRYQCTSPKVFFSKTWLPDKSDPPRQI